MAEFYTAKQNNKCQWYGILHNFDVIRKDYDKIKDIVVQSFKNQSCRMSAIIYGNGGCGKSTLLRRLAVEMSQNEIQKPLQEQIQIVWINDNGFEDFYNEGLPIIGKNFEITYLIIIEDWYRITEHDKEIAYKFLKKADSISNMRIVIGDRIVEKKCKDLLDGEPILLSPDENKSIITTIIENNKEWKEIADELFADENHYHCSLFLLLFIMAYASQNKNTQLNFSKPKKAFIDIIENDLKFIANTEDKKYIGLAKALYYWACIYERHRNFISYDTFLAVADYYNENNKISKYFSRWSMRDPILDRLKIYINKNSSIGKYNDKDFVQFNHDILADEGLSKIDWGFSDTVKVDLLEVITDFGDDISASSFLEIMLTKEKQIFKNKGEKLLLVDKLIEKGNTSHSYVNALLKVELDDNEKKEYAHKLLKIENYAGVFWHSYFLSVKFNIVNDVVINNKLKSFLMASKFNSSNLQFTGDLLDQFSDDESVQKFLEDILNNCNWKDFHSTIVYSCLEILKNNEAKQNFSKKALEDKNWKNIDSYLINSCLNYAENKIKQDFSKKALEDNDWKNIDDRIIDYCLSYAEDKIKQDFSKKALEDKDCWGNIDSYLISRCLYYAEDKKKRFYKKNIERRGLEKIRPQYNYELLLSFRRYNKTRFFKKNIERGRLEKNKPKYNYRLLT